MALRAETVGNDLNRYLSHYILMDYGNIWTSPEGFGYILFIRGLNFLGFSPRMFVVFVSFIVSTSVSWFIYKYSPNIGLSFFLYVTIGAFSFTMSSVSQSIALCLVLFAIHFVIERKLISFLIITALASTFHLSAICFFPIYFISNFFQKPYKLILLFLVFIAISIFSFDVIFSLMTYLAPQRYFIKYVLGSHHNLDLISVVVPIFIPLSIFLLWRIQKNKYFNIIRRNKFFLFLSIIGGVIMILGLNLSVLTRMALYFSIVNVVLVPNALERFNVVFNKCIVVFPIIILCVIYFVLVVNGGILNIDNYLFYWS